MATKKFDPDKRTIEICAERDGVKLTMLISPSELTEVLRSSSKEERVFVVQELSSDAGDVWEMMQAEVKKYADWSEWEKPS